ncbi:Acetyltransferase component of pyruvate dehydrogenase complex [Heracleum sosnowskyi]|uniref:Acetyltransferase component of pyruvate dehydrogenase complex n=1 Tax=Heracleum sosnowskyi TaxID=360622 RepID=A0AAD8M5D6_9APIA|nr:Acetyltransferase component of pyruvate dehydrogenase complex [Heracleum sosnowskyi]
MSYAVHIFRHSKKLKSASGLLRHDHAIFVRWLSSDALTFANGREDIVKLRGISNGPQERDGACNNYTSTTNCFNYSCSSINPSMVTSVGCKQRNSSTTNIKLQSQLVGSVLSRGFSSSLGQYRRSFSSGSGFPPHQEIGMPSLSPTMTEGNIARWLKKEGDQVSTGEVLCEVETDKATVEMECMEEGYLAKIVHGDGAKEIKVGEVIAITVEDEGDIAKFKDYTPSKSEAEAPPKDSSVSTPPKEDVVEKPTSSPEPKPSKASAEKETGSRIFASPLAKKLAEENNVSLSSIKGTGPDGNIVKADIEDYLASRGKEAPSKASKASKADRSAVSAIDYTDIPVSQIRKVTASRLLLSKQTIPHYYLTVDTRVDKLMDLRAKLNALQEASGRKRISVNDLVIKAAALALRKVPQCNSSWTNEYIRQYHNVNINVAVQTENGLFVPVIRDADMKGLSRIGDEVKHLAQKAKENSLKPEDYEGGTFTVSNLGGPFGVKQFCAIINPPQAGILAVGSAEKRVIPGAGSDQYAFASFMAVTLSCDHRVIDGAIGAEWLKAFKGYIENPETMLL